MVTAGVKGAETSVGTAAEATAEVATAGAEKVVVRASVVMAAETGAETGEGTAAWVKAEAAMAEAAMAVVERGSFVT